MTSQLQRHISNNITTLRKRLLIDVFFATLLQRRDMVERRRDLKTTTLQRRHDVACLLGNTLTVSAKKLRHRCSTGFQMHFRLGILKMWGVGRL